MPRREKRDAVLWTIFASLLWGTSFPGVKWGLGFVGNDVLFLWLRFIAASAFTIVFVLFLKKVSFSVLKDPWIWLIGALNAGAFVAQYVGLNYTTASKTTLLVDINVVAVAIISFFIFKERLGRLQSAGIASGVVGIVLLTAEGNLSFGSSQFAGDVIVYLAGWGWAFFIIFNKKVLDRYSALQVSSGAIMTSTVWLVVPVSYLLFVGADMSVEPKGWFAVLYLGLFCTSVATLLFVMGLEGVSATASATIMLVEIVTALAISIGFLGESLTLMASIGAALVLAAVYLVSAGESPQEKRSMSHT